jgi:DNA-binding NtrC family response regulator
MVELNAVERSFFTLVRKAVSANPFSEKRQALDLQIIGGYDRRPSERDVDKVAHEVGDRIQNLVKQKRADVRMYTGKDRNLVKSAFLFDVFHQYIPQFDQLIVDQVATEDRHLPVYFATEALARLRNRGFTAAEACRYFELFFQMRRAFFFIQQSLVGRSPCMVKLRESLWNNIFTHSIDLYDEHLWNRMEDFSTMILGPTGAGKGTAAAAIGRSGYIPFDPKNNSFVENFTSAFISINLSQYSETLIESELFGHKKGAFTGAIENYQGVFDRCSPYGAILLDEIGEVSRPIQIKLLQVLQERYFMPVGDHTRRRFSGRVIAATNRPLAQLRERGFLRDDFFYRLCSDIVFVPSLSRRIAEDYNELKVMIDLTVQRILGKSSPDQVNRLHRQINDQLGRDYPWPGNVRELEQCVRRLLVSNRYTPFQTAINLELDKHLQEGIAKGTIDAQSLISGYCYLLYQRHGTYEAVAKRVQFDRRTAKKHIELGMRQFEKIKDSGG